MLFMFKEPWGFHYLIVILTLIVMPEPLLPFSVGPLAAQEMALFYQPDRTRVSAENQLRNDQNLEGF